MAGQKFTSDRRSLLARSLATLALGGVSASESLAAPAFDPAAYVSRANTLGFGLVACPAERSFFLIPEGFKGPSRERWTEISALNAAMLADPDGIGKVADLLV